MIGIFLINNDGEPAFAQYGVHQNIAQFRLHRDVGMCVVVTSDGSEETLDDELPQEIIERIKKRNALLVAHINPDGTVATEYESAIELA